jgi:hypothetical protein
MASAGHAFIAHTKGLSPAAQTKDGEYGLPPHPLIVRAGQRYWSRGSRRREVLVVERVVGERVIVSILGDRRQRTSLAVTGVLATREDGQGRNYQFQGFSPKRYDTHAYVAAVEGPEAVLYVPEWHPRRRVRLPSRLLPATRRNTGGWLALRCDLSASSAARLQPSDLRPCEDPGARLAHRPEPRVGRRSGGRTVGERVQNT